MEARNLRPGDVVVLVGVKVESVLVSDDTVVVMYAEANRPGEVFKAHDVLVVAREEEA